MLDPILILKFSCFPVMKLAYRCDSCSYSTDRRSDLIKHSSVHTNIRPYSCVYCDKCFKQSSHLRQHVKRIHKRIQIVRSKKIAALALLKQATAKVVVPEGFPQISEAVLQPEERPMFEDVVQCLPRQDATIPTATLQVPLYGDSS